MIRKLWPFIVSLLLVAAACWYGNRSINKIKYDYEAQAKALQDLHNAEVDEINKARKIEKEKLEANMAKLQEKLLENQREYEKKIADLISKKSREAGEIAKKAPVDIANDVSAATGFKVYQPVK